jgi:hypothetical protein
VRPASESTLYLSVIELQPQCRRKVILVKTAMIFMDIVNEGAERSKWIEAFLGIE